MFLQKFKFFFVTKIREKYIFSIHKKIISVVTTEKNCNKNLQQWIFGTKIEKQIFVKIWTKIE